MKSKWVYEFNYEIDIARSTIKIVAENYKEAEKKLIEFLQSTHTNKYSFILNNDYGVWE